jgi:hypothetical protein
VTLLDDRVPFVTAASVPMKDTTERLSPRWLAAGGLGCAAVAVWSATRVDLTRIDDLGLAVALPVSYWVALVGLNAAFFTALRRPAISNRIMIVLLGALIVTLFGVAPIASSIPRGEAVWRHLGIVDQLSRTGRIDGNIDAYFNWPGFFTASQAVVALAGVRSLVTVARWAPVWFNVLWVWAASLPLRVLTRDRRHLWFGLWVFCLLNWIDQDYYSPQAFAFFLYLVILGLVLSLLGASPSGRLAAFRRASASTTRGVRSWWRSRYPVGNVSTRQRSIAVGLAVLCGLAVIVSHQLTPIALIVVLAAIIVAGRLWSTRLPFIFGTALLVWLITAASDYLIGHPVLSFGDLGDSVGANVGRRLSGSSGHMLVVRERMLLSLVIAGLASVGALRRRHWRHHLTTDTGLTATVAMAVAPFTLVPAQSYGGEMLLRATLFALPFMAVLISDALVPSDHEVAARPPFMRWAAVAVIASVLAAASVFARYGNTRFDMFTGNEVAAVQQMYALAPTGGVLVSAAHPTPWRYQQYDDFTYTTLADVCRDTVGSAACAQAIAGRIQHGEHGGMLLVLRSSRESLRMQGVMSSAELAGVEKALNARPNVELVYENVDAHLYLFGAST